MLLDSDLDWGQDLTRLERELHERHVARLSLAYFGGADVCHQHLPPGRWLRPRERATGIIAISEMYRKGVVGSFYRNGDYCDRTQLVNDAPPRTPISSRVARRLHFDRARRRVHPALRHSRHERESGATTLDAATNMASGSRGATLCSRAPALLVLAATYPGRLSTPAGYFLIAGHDDGPTGAFERPERVVVTLADGLGADDAQHTRAVRWFRAHGRCFLTQVGSPSITRPLNKVISSGVELAGPDRDPRQRRSGSGRRGLRLGERAQQRLERQGRERAAVVAGALPERFRRGPLPAG